MEYHHKASKAQTKTQALTHPSHEKETLLKQHCNNPDFWNYKIIYRLLHCSTVFHPWIWCFQWCLAGFPFLPAIDCFLLSHSEWPKMAEISRSDWDFAVVKVVDNQQGPYEAVGIFPRRSWLSFWYFLCWSIAISKSHPTNRVKSLEQIALIYPSYLRYPRP